MTRRTFICVQVVAVLGMACLIALPYFLYTLRPEYQGLVPMRSGDDGMYFGHIQTALLGRYSEVANGTTGGTPPAQGAGPALLELLAGTLFSWTGWQGPQVSVLVTFLLAPLTIPLLTAVLRVAGLSRAFSLSTALAYTVVFLSTLQRPVQLSWTMPLSLVALLLLFRAWQTPRSAIVVLAGASLAVFPAIYFWTWTYLWAVGGSLLLVHLLFGDADERKRRRTIALLAVGAMALVLSSPSFMKLWTLHLTHPFFAEVALRSNVVPSRWVESLPRSILLTALAGSALLLASRERKRTTVLLPLAMVLAAFTVMHQNLLHGTDFMFSSHYYPYVSLAATAMAGWVLQQGALRWDGALTSSLRGVIVAVAGIFLLAGVWDYRVAWAYPTAPREHLEFQHLVPALASLRDGERETILTDYRSALVVTSWTDDDVVFTPYVRHLLVSNEEFAERYCLSEFPHPDGPDISWIAWEATQVQSHHLFPQREREFTVLCEQLLSHPADALRRYGVDLLLWNHRERPTWRVPLAFFDEVARGEGWSLFRLISSPR